MLTIKIVTSTNENIIINTSHDDVTYAPQIFTGELENLIIDDSMPIKFSQSQQEEILLPVGWHKGKLIKYDFSKPKIQLIAVSFYDDSSCFLVQDDINKVFQENKKMLLISSIEKSWKDFDSLIIAINRMQNESPLKVIKDMYQYDIRVIE